MIQLSRKITKEELIERFNKLHNELQRVPTQTEMGHREPIKRLYGGYNEFLRDLDHLPNFLRTKDDYIKYIRNLHKELIHVPSLSDLEHRGIYRLSIYEIFGSYNNLLIAAGFEAREKIYTDKTREELLADYIELCNKIGRWATTRELESIDIYENRFGSIIEVRKLVLNDPKLLIENKTIKEQHQKYTDRDIENFLKKSIKIYGETIRTADLIAHLKEIEGPSINTIMKRHKVTSFRKLIEIYKD